MLRIRRTWTMLTCLLMILCTQTPTGADQGGQSHPPPLQTVLVPPPASVADLDGILAGQQAIQQDIRRLHREIAALRAGQLQPGVTEILGGIGYIIGFFGLYAWFRTRKGLL